MKWELCWKKLKISVFVRCGRQLGGAFMPGRSLLPPPPAAAVVSGPAEAGVTGLFAVIALAALVYALVDWRRTGKPALFCLCFWLVGRCSSWSR
jgi:hypothetical protein